jgi:hypothetical protein
MIMMIKDGDDNDEYTYMMMIDSYDLDDYNINDGDYK